jgi:predicted regulator of Ras-like GTPase activity (Roadblock/LC7/MglB family)
MRAEDLHVVAEALRQPMATFVRESRVRTAILINHSGQVLARHGFTRSYDVTNVAALAAAAHASAHALAHLTGAGRWVHMHHAGRETQLFLAPIVTGDSQLVLVAIFDDDSTLGLVQLFFDRLVEAILQVPELSGRVPRGDAEGFERDLEAGIERLLSGPEED